MIRRSTAKSKSIHDHDPLTCGLSYGDQHFCDACVIEARAAAAIADRAFQRRQERDRATPFRRLLRTGRLIKRLARQAVALELRDLDRRLKRLERGGR